MSALDHWVSGWANLSCFSVPSELLTCPLFPLRPVLLCTLGRTSYLLRNPALINYPSCVHTSASQVELFPQWWNCWSLRHLKKMNTHPLTPCTLWAQSTSPSPSCCLFHHIRWEQGSLWTGSVCALCVIFAPLYLPEGPSQPTHCGELCLQSPHRPLTPPLFCVHPENQVNFGKSNMAFALLAWRCWGNRSCRRKVLIWRGVFFS